MKEKNILFFIFLIMFWLGSFLIFFIFTKLCLQLSLSIKGANIVWEGSSFKITSAEERRYRNLVEKMVFKIADTYSQLLFPSIKKIPRIIPHPIVQLEKPNCVSPYYRPTTQEYVRHECMVYTPYVNYAPAPGNIGGAFHNRQQFRYPEDLNKKLSNEIRIFITGGSAAWGCLAPNDESTIPSFLEKELKKYKHKNFFFRVINAACGGYHTTDERIWIFNRITEYEPDIIISYSGYNDIYNVYRVHHDLFSSLHNESSYYYWVIREYEHYNNRDFVLNHTPDFAKLLYNKEDFPRKTLKNIQIIASYLNTIGIEYIFILQPIRSDNPKEVLEMAEILEKTLKEKSKTSPPFIFLSYKDLFRKKEEYFIDLCHLGDIGNQIIAQRLVKDLEPVILEVIRKREKSEK
jgi:lysophospholipase L1-like esterase